MTTDDAGENRRPRAPRRRRADAQRNIDALLEAAKAVFATSGVDAPAKEIADLAGVGVGTLYRHFPQRSDLVVAVLQREIDACADAGPALSAAHAPGEALAQWLHRYTEFLATKRGSPPPCTRATRPSTRLPGYFWQRLGPALAALLDAAAADGEIRADVSAKDLLTPSPSCAMPAPGTGARVQPADGRAARRRPANHRPGNRGRGREPGLGAQRPRRPRRRSAR